MAASSTGDILSQAAAEAAVPGADTSSAYECPFCVMMRKGGCEEAFKVRRCCCCCLPQEAGLRAAATPAAAPQAASAPDAGHGASSTAMHAQQLRTFPSMLPPAATRRPQPPPLPRAMHAQAFMECGERADKGEQEMAACLPQVSVCMRAHACASCSGSARWQLWPPARTQQRPLGLHWCTCRAGSVSSSGGSVGSAALQALWGSCCPRRTLCFAV